MIEFILFIVVISILVFVHELGHFIAAKSVGVKVEEFAIGFPPRIFKKIKGETLYSIGAIPFGGFVKLYGEDVADKESIKEPERSLFGKNRLAQAWVMVAGVVFNLVFAWILAFFVFNTGIDIKETKIGSIQNPKIIISQVEENSPAAKSGLLQGDSIVSASYESKTLSGKELVSENFIDFVKNSEGKEMNIKISRFEDSKEIQKDILVKPLFDNSRKVFRLGIGLQDLTLEKQNIKDSFISANYFVFDTTKQTFQAFGGLIAKIGSNEKVMDQVSGPVGIAKFTKQSLDFGLGFLLMFISLISINLAVLNILPLPALDGGRIFVLAIESIIRRSISPKWIAYVHAAGFLLLMLFSVFVTINDIRKFF